jgi:hypothetical protein
MLALLAAPARFETEISAEFITEWLELACLRCRKGGTLGPMCAGFRRTPRRISDTEDCLAERSGFEPPKPFGLLHPVT